MSSSRQLIWCHTASQSWLLQQKRTSFKMKTNKDSAEIFDEVIRNFVIVSKREKKFISVHTKCGC